MSHNWQALTDSVYRIQSYFCPVIFILLHLQCRRFHPILNSSSHSCGKRDIREKIVSSSLKFTNWQWEWGGKNKMGVNNSLYAVHVMISHGPRLNKWLASHLLLWHGMVSLITGHASVCKSSSSSGIFAISSSPSTSENATFFSDPAVEGLLSPTPEFKTMPLLSFFGISLLLGFFQAFQTLIVWSHEQETYFKQTDKWAQYSLQ